MRKGVGLVHLGAWRPGMMQRRALILATLLLFLPAVCTQVAHVAGWLPEHARAGDAAHNQTRAWEKACWREARAQGQGTPPQPSADCDQGGEVRWGEIEQLCDHFTKATLTPGKTHMQRDMADGGNSRRAEGHANAFACRFKQRFAVDSSAWNSPVGPVLLYVSGPHPLEGTPGGLIREMARSLGALVVAVEHRFYGESVPRWWKHEEGLELLTQEQAVADLAGFRDKYQRIHIAPLGSASNPWILVGCGGGGTLAAWARRAHPQRFIGAVASSPVLQPALQNPTVDEQVPFALCYPIVSLTTPTVPLYSTSLTVYYLIVTLDCTSRWQRHSGRHAWRTCTPPCARSPLLLKLTEVPLLL